MAHIYLCVSIARHVGVRKGSNCTPVGCCFYSTILLHGLFHIPYSSCCCCMCCCSCCREPAREWCQQAILLLNGPVHTSLFGMRYNPVNHVTLLLANLLRRTRSQLQSAKSQQAAPAWAHNRAPVAFVLLLLQVLQASLLVV